MFFFDMLMNDWLFDAKLWCATSAFCRRTNNHGSIVYFRDCPSRTYLYCTGRSWSPLYWFYPAFVMGLRQYAAGRFKMNCYMHRLIVVVIHHHMSEYNRRWRNTTSDEIYKKTRSMQSRSIFIILVLPWLTKWGQIIDPKVVTWMEVKLVQGQC